MTDTREIIENLKLAMMERDVLDLAMGYRAKAAGHLFLWVDAHSVPTDEFLADAKRRLRMMVSEDSYEAIIEQIKKNPDYRTCMLK